MSDSEDDAEQQTTSVQQLLSARLGADPDSASDEDDEPAEPPAATEIAATRAVVLAGEALLPSALDMLEPTTATPNFLHVAGPEFDASKCFKPPPVSAADFGPVTDQHLRSTPNVGEQQRAHAEYDWGRSGVVAGSNRLHGSVCIETDDERGRRVKYGAHAMLRADPWSACNPNYAMNDSSVTRGKDRGKAPNVGLGKRKLAE